MRGYPMMFTPLLTLLLACQPQEQPVPAHEQPGVPEATVITTPEPTRLTRDSVNQVIYESRQTVITTAVRAISPAVVGINVTEIREYRDPFADLFRNDPFFNHFFQQRRSQQYEVKGLGSGFIISPDGYILTNYHVAGNASKIIVTLPGGRKFDAEIVGSDPISDIALLKVDGKNLPFLELGNSDQVMVGEWAIALGNPFGLFDINDQPTVTVGVVSNTRMNFVMNENRIYRDMIQTDAAINSGNSGGPLCNALGEVIGVNSFIYTGGQFNQGNIGLGFAIPINRAKSIVEELKATGKVDRSFWSGLKVQTLDPAVARYFNLKNVEGVVVVEVENGSPAEKSDVRPADVITRINNLPIRTSNDLLIFQRDSKPGDKLDLDIVRDGKDIKKTVTLARRPDGK
ncbi:MAG: trypsin-like peptidase domain-containing protein [Bacteroidetes bacterium]|nr:trypsin-like peptidase domain-containing protein [Bacteroidota bacterium]